jgi:hypothetical protein
MPPHGTRGTLGRTPAHSGGARCAVHTAPGRDGPGSGRRREMINVGDQTAAPGLHFAMDSLATSVHGNADSHIDSLSIDVAPTSPHDPVVVVIRTDPLAAAVGCSGSNKV